MDHAVKDSQQSDHMHVPDRRRETLRSAADSTKKCIVKTGHVVFMQLRQAHGEQKGKGIFERSINPYLLNVFTCLRVFAITACIASGMHDAEIDEFLDGVGLQLQEIQPCDWIDETNEDSHRNESLIKELRGDIDQLRADNNDLRDDNRRMRSDTTQIAKEARLAIDKLNKKSRQIGHFEEENKILRARIAALEAEKEGMNKVQANIQQQCLELRRQVGDADISIHGQYEGDDIEAKLQQRDDEVAELREELNQERELHSRASARHDCVVESLQADIARRVDEFSSKSVLCASVESERDQLRREVECLRARLNALKDDDSDALHGDDSSIVTPLALAVQSLPEDKKCAVAKMAQAEQLALLREQMEWKLPDHTPGKPEIRCKNQQALALALVAFAILYKTYTVSGGIQMEKIDQIRVARKIEAIAAELKSSGCPFLLFSDANELAKQAKEYIKGKNTLQNKIYNVRRSCVWEMKDESDETIEQVQKLQSSHNIHRKQQEFFVRIGLYSVKEKNNT